MCAACWAGIDPVWFVFVLVFWKGNGSTDKAEYSAKSGLENLFNNNNDFMDLFGILFFITAIFQVFACCISLIGIPAALVVAKSLGTLFNPVGKKCVPQAVIDELEKRKAKEVIKAHLG